jgi:hypothetical protein
MTKSTNALLALQARLLELRGAQPLNAFARKVGVAPNTLLEVMKAEKGQLRRSIDAIGEKPVQRAKRLSGRSESVGRIVQFATDGEQDPIDAEEILKELGLDPTNPNVKQGLSRAREAARSADLFLTHGDLVLERIVRGSGSRKRGEIRIGIASWSAYSGEGDNLAHLIGAKLMRRLVGCLRLSKEEPVLVPLSLSESVTVDPIKEGRIDAVFGLYDTPARRLAGFDFIHLPGLAARMGALVFGADECRWRDIVDPDERAGADLEVYVIDGEAGDLLVSGLGYPTGRMHRFEPTRSFSEIAGDLVGSASVLPQSKTAKPFAFVGDSFMIDQVADQITKLLATSRVQAPPIQKLDDVGSPAHEGTPHYLIGIGVSANATRWRTILRDTLVSELFGNGRILTARSYARLLLEPSSLTIVPLEPNLRRQAANSFATEVLQELENDRIVVGIDAKPSLRQHLTYIVESIQHNWLSDMENRIDNFPRLKQLVNQRATVT